MKKYEVKNVCTADWSLTIPESQIVEKDSTVTIFSNTETINLVSSFLKEKRVSHMVIGHYIHIKDNCNVDGNTITKWSKTKVITEIK